MMKVYRVELLVVDHDNIGADSVRQELENARHANRCISPSVMSVDTREVEWDDSHPLNYTGKQEAEFRRLFAKEPQ
jgi:hypothetical protein